jgi:hypothetical protein
MGGSWVLARLWERLEIGQAIRRVAAGRRLDGEAAERVILALTAQRALEPTSKLAATQWVAERVFIEGCPGYMKGALRLRPVFHHREDRIRAHIQRGGRDVPGQARQLVPGPTAVITRPGRTMTVSAGLAVRAFRQPGRASGP